MIQVTLEPSADGGYTATISDRPGCISEGETVPEALRNLAEAIELFDEPE
jgi:predicted RNase H-like HicB family nuclease